MGDASGARCARVVTVKKIIILAHRPEGA